MQTLKKIFNMKNTLKTFVLILLGLPILLNHSCKKDDNPPLTDQDGNVYTSVTIGTQVWMVENLKTTKYRNGDLIGTTTPATLDITAEATPKYQWAYEGNEDNVATYGRLYTWYAATDPRKICPSGWHVPSEAEWDTLIAFVGEIGALDKLIEAGSTHWQTWYEGATNSSGFTALPGGFRYSMGPFAGEGISGNWWNSTMVSPTAASNLYISITNSILRVWSPPSWGFSVRCLRD
jgi:uncharacterized protein (TIGR02145 family)